MKKRTAFISAILSLVPLGQPLLIKTGLVLSSSAVILSLPEKLYAENVDYYLSQLEEIYQTKGEEYKTIFYANEILKLNPNSLDGYWYRAYAMAEIKRYYEAIADYSKAIALGDNDSNTFNNRGFAKHNLGDYYGAISDFNKAIEINPNNGLAYSNRGISLGIGFKDDEGACNDFKKAAILGNQYRIMWLDSSEGKWCKDI